MNMQDRVDNDIEQVFLESTGFGEDIIFVPEGDPLHAFPLRGIFDLTSTDVTAGTRQAVILRKPMLTLLERAVRAELNRLPLRNDCVFVRKTSYRIDSIEPDGCGFVVLHLLESDDE
jgi:hypothetical protein